MLERREPKVAGEVLGRNELHDHLLELEARGVAQMSARVVALHAVIRSLFDRGRSISVIVARVTTELYTHLQAIGELSPTRRNWDLCESVVEDIIRREDIFRSARVECVDCGTVHVAKSKRRPMASALRLGWSLSCVHWRCPEHSQRPPRVQGPSETGRRPLSPSSDARVIHVNFAAKRGR
jgi:hypothetical protein